MTAPDFDRALAHEPSIEPSPFFAARVMRAVRQDAAGHQPLPFPWKIMVPGVVLSTALIVVAVLTMSAPSFPVHVWLDTLPELREAAQALSIAIVGSAVTTWWFART